MDVTNSVPDGDTIVTIYDERSSQVQVLLNKCINWTPLQNHFWERLGLVRWKGILDAVIGFEEGSLSNKDVLVNWSTGAYGLDVTKSARTVRIFLKGTNFLKGDV